MPFQNESQGSIRDQHIASNPSILDGFYSSSSSSGSAAAPAGG